MATTVNRSVSIYVESGEAEKAYNRLIKKQEELEAALKEATNPKQVERLNRELDKLKEPIDRATKKMKGDLTPSIKDLEKSITQIQHRLKQTGIGEKEFAELSIQLRKANIELDKAKNKMNDLGNTAGKEGGSLTRLGGRFSSITGISLGGAAAVTGAALVLRHSINEAFEEQEHISRFRNTLEALGKENLFEPLSKQAEKLADDLKTFGSDDTFVIFEKLLNYGKLTQVEIERLTPIIIDFSAKNKMTFEQAAEEIVKYLDGSSREIKKYGLSAKEAGTTTERLGQIFNELAPKVAGAMETFGETPQGKIDAMREKFNDLTGQLGNKLLPVIVHLTEYTIFMLEGLKWSVNKVVDGFNFLFDRSYYYASKALEELKRIREEAEAEGAEYGRMLSEGKTFEEVGKKLEEQTRNLNIAKRLLEKAIEEGNKEDEEYQQSIVYSRQATVDFLQKQYNSLVEQEKRNAAELAAKRKKEAEKHAQELQRHAEELRKMWEELLRKEEDISLYNTSQLQRDLVRIDRYYNSLIQRARGNSELIKKIEEVRLQETRHIVQEHFRKIQEEELKASQKIAEEKERIEKERLARLLQLEVSIVVKNAKTLAKAQKEAAALAELEVLKATGREVIEARKRQLEVEMQLELNAAEGMENTKKLIREKYRQKTAEVEIEFWTDFLENALSIAEPILQGLDNFFSAISSREQEQLERDRYFNERKKDNYKQQLDSKLISEKEYIKKSRELDKQQEAREKQIRIRQFNRDKISNIASATMTGAKAVLEALATPPVPNIPLSVLVGALTAAQIASIAAAKPPQYAKGGQLNGPSHQQGGMPVIDPVTGRKVAEVEGGEVILSKKTVINNPEITAALLESSMKYEGKRIDPLKVMHRHINFPSVANTISSIKKYETGGFFKAPENNNDVNEKILNTLNTLTSVLASGIKASTYISQNEEAAERMNAIRKVATMR